jgi:hypothetical protein
MSGRSQIEHHQEMLGPTQGKRHINRFDAAEHGAGHLTPRAAGGMRVRLMWSNARRTEEPSSFPAEIRAIDRYIAAVEACNRASGLY